MFYFAYGSNLCWDQMRARCFSARFVSVALLPGYKLAFTRKSVRRDCGVADVVVASEKEVWGVVYEVNELDIGDLDSSEGYGLRRKKNAYIRRESVVFLDGDSLRPLTVFVYFAVSQPNPPLPNTEYKDLILSGARYWGLPAEYLSELAEIEVCK